ncbi:MAG: FKBP-type peptidyl-prolyl cis-trans isomerase [Planctomycetaceae bacterium]
MARRRRLSQVRSRRRSREFGIEGLEGRQLLAGNVAVASDVGPTSTPLVRIVDAETGVQQASVMAFEAGFKGGVRLAMGRVTGNAAADVVATCGSGRVAEVKVFKPNGATLTEVLSFRPFGDSYKGGCEVAVGNVDGVGAEDIIVSKSREGGDIKVFRVTNAGGTTSVALHATIAKPFGASYNGGSSVGVADVGEFTNGALVKRIADNKVEILVGSGSGIPAQVKVYDLSRPGTPRVADTITPVFNGAYGLPFVGGVTVTSGSYAATGVADSIEEIVISAGRGGSGAAQTLVYDGTVSAAANTILRGFTAFGANQRPNASVFAAAVDADGNGQVDRFLVTQGDPGGPVGISNVSVAGVRSATPVTNLVGPLRIATPRTVFATQTINGTVATPSPTAGVAAGASRPMQTRDIVTGAGTTAATGQSVVVKFTGMLPDGTVFDSAQTSTFTLGSGSAISGWQAGILGMKVGGRRLLEILPELAFGDAGRTGVPGKSKVIYDMELVSATSPATIGGTATGAVTAGVGAMNTGDTLTVTDPDAGQAKFATPATAALTGTYGTFTFNATTGAWGYALDTSRPATLLLRAPATVTDSLTVTSLDGTATKTITVTITGFTLQTMSGLTTRVPANSGTIPAGSTSSLQYADMVTGTGATATTGKTLNVNYLGMLTDGTVFNSWRNFSPLVLGTTPLIAGWDYGLVGMKVGGQRLLVIPPELAYGDPGSQTGDFKNTTLIFKIELLSAT